MTNVIDQRSIHSIDISEQYLSNYFTFKVDDSSISKNGMDRIFNYAKRIFQHENNNSGSDAWSIISKHHSNLVSFCLNKDYDNFSKLMKSIATTPLVLGFMNYHSCNDLLNDANLRKI